MTFFDLYLKTLPSEYDVDKEARLSWREMGFRRSLRGFKAIVFDVSCFWNKSGVGLTINNFLIIEEARIRFDVALTFVLI